MLILEKFKRIKNKIRYSMFISKKIIVSLCLSLLMASCSSLLDSSTGAALKEVRQSGFLKNEDKTKTIKGIDANQNGVRDDIEQYLKLKYAKHPEYLDVYMRYAKSIQHQLILNSSDREAYRQAHHQTILEMACAFRVNQKIAPTKMYGETMLIYAVSVNTKQRKNEIHRISSMLSGMVFSSPSKEHCKN